MTTITRISWSFPLTCIDKQTNNQTKEKSMIDPNSIESAAKLLRFAEKMFESEHAEEFRHVIDVVTSLREKISDLEWELKQRPHQEEYRKLYKEKEQWRAGAHKLKEHLEHERREREAAQRTIARLGGQVEDERSQRVAAEGMVEFFAGEEP